MAHDLNLTVIKEEVTTNPAKNIYDGCQTYNMTLAICQILFGKNCVKHDDNTITIKDRINLTLSLSWNETKIYFYSYILGDTPQPEAQELRHNNSSFRLFSFEEIHAYLQIKHTENEFIKHNEG